MLSIKATPIKLPIIAAAGLALTGLGQEAVKAQDSGNSAIDKQPFSLRIDAGYRSAAPLHVDIDFSKLTVPAVPRVIYVDRPVISESHATAADHEGASWEKKSHLFSKLLSAALIVGGGLMMYKRCLPNLLHVNILQPGYPELAVEKNIDDLTLAQTTVLSSSLPGLYHHDIPAFVKFYTAMVNGYRHAYWPVANFSNSRLMRSISGGYAAEVIAPELLAAMSEQIEYDAAPITQTAADKRIANGHPPEFIVSKTFFTCITFEKTETRQPRAYLIPMANIIDILANFKTWWQAAINSGSSDLMQKICRQLGMAISLIWRYPQAVKNFFDYSRRAKNDPIRIKIDTAFEAAEKMLKILSLEPKESVQFLEKAFNRGEIAQPEPDDFQKIYRAFYGTNDPVKQKKLIELEQKGLTKLSEYNRFCHKHDLPMWFMMFHSIKK